MRRLASCLMLALLMACGDADAPGYDTGKADPDSDSDSEDAGTARCIDADGDGFGRHCADGADCNDADETLFDDCPACVDIAEGCGCGPDAAPVECSLTAEQLRADSNLCKTGTRYCRDRVWTTCIGVAALPQ